MTRREMRHFSEEELLMHVLGEPGASSEQLKSHLAECSECRSVCREFERVYAAISRWQAPDPGDDAWRRTERSVLSAFREDMQRRYGAGFFERPWRMWMTAWNYALENPLPTLGYIAAAAAFASERTITVFRLDRVLPETSQLLEMLRQVLQG